MAAKVIYNMSKQTKRFLGTMSGETRNVFKKMMMSAELAAIKAKTQKPPKQTDGE
jgi:hypothetical protein